MKIGGNVNIVVGIVLDNARHPHGMRLGFPFPQFDAVPRRYAQFSRRLFGQKHARIVKGTASWVSRFRRMIYSELVCLPGTIRLTLIFLPSWAASMVWRP